MENKKKTEFPERVNALKSSLTWIRCPKENHALILFSQRAIQSGFLSKDRVFKRFAEFSLTSEDLPNLSARTRARIWQRLALDIINRNPTMWR